MRLPINTQIWPWFAFVISASLLLGALAFEHIGGMAPCQMCYWQRHAHKAVLIISILALITQRRTSRWNGHFSLLIGLAFAASLALSFWHIGVEYKWWDGPKSCMASKGPIEFNPETLFTKDIKMPACSDAPWDLFGISMAGYNALISGLGGLLSLLALKGRK